MTALIDITTRQGGHKVLEPTLLTPELAKRLLDNPHPRQRHISRPRVDSYARTIRDGRWRLNPADAILVASDGRMFNGGHRCSAVVQARTPIEVYIDWNADPSLFSVIDSGLSRAPHQFISESDATARASAARLRLWREHRFDRPPMGVNIQFDLSEVLAEVEAHREVLDSQIANAHLIYGITGLSRSVCLAVFSIAADMGAAADVDTFVYGVVDYTGTEPEDARRAFAERFRKHLEHRTRRRQTVADWTILVRAFNLFIWEVPVRHLILTEIWPDVGESEEDFHRRRRSAAHAAFMRRKAERTDK